jgi:hypothetical protein
MTDPTGRATVELTTGEKIPMARVTKWGFGNYQRSAFVEPPMADCEGNAALEELRSTDRQLCNCANPEGTKASRS